MFTSTRRRFPVSRFVPIAVALVAVSFAHAAAWSAPVLTPERDPLVQNMDHAVRPGTDFFRYACGGWLKKNPIPASERGWGIANLVQDETFAQLRGICEAAATSNAPHGSIDQKVGDFWAVGMDSAAIDAQGAAPLAPYLAQIAAIGTRQELADLIARFQANQIGPVYGLYVGQDERSSDNYIVHLGQGGIGLPNRDYYFNTDSTTKRVRAEYRKHLVAVFGLLGEDEGTAQRSARAVFDLEKLLAGRSRRLEDLRDPWANYNKMSLAELNHSTPGLDWTRHFATMGVRGVDSVVVGQPEFLELADSCMTAVPIEDWKAYLRWNLVGELSPYLSHAFDVEHFRFYGTVMNGTTVQRPRWKRVLEAEERGIGELMGMAWVRQYCSPATKARYEKLTEDIFAVYRERMQSLSWMTAATRQRAIDKLDHVGKKVAYPDHWRDYSGLDFDRSSFANVHLKVNEWWFHHEADKLGKPIDRTEWDMSPQTYNAYYDPSKDEIVLPAAVFLIPGVPDSLVDDALLYSYAGGSTIGHEITHGFDDEGRQFDANGNLNPWWEASDSVQFTRRTRLLVKQFDQYRVGDLHVRGQACLGENIADLGGVRLGYEAFKKTAQYRSGEKINGFTPDQRYFLGYALSWLGARRPQSLAQQIMTDVHAPGFLRVNGPLVNIPEFFTAFGIKPGDRMWRPANLRCAIW